MTGPWPNARSCCSAWTPACRDGPAVMAARLAVADLAGILAERAGLGAPADCLVWINGCEAIERSAAGRPAGARAAHRDGPLLSTTAGAAAARLAGHVNIVAVRGQAPPGLAGPPGVAASATAGVLAGPPGSPAAALASAAVPVPGPASPPGPPAPVSLNPQDSQGLPGGPAGRAASRRAVPAGPQPGAAADHGLPGGAVSAGPDQICLGWQFAPALADPGPPPPRPASRARRPDRSRLAGRAGADLPGDQPPGQGRSSGRRAGGRPARRRVAGRGRRAGRTGCGTLAALAGAAGCARSAWRDRRRLERRDRRRAAPGRRSPAPPSRACWRPGRASMRPSTAPGSGARLSSTGSRPGSPSACLPGIDRIDVAGGTLAGWSALVTMLATPRLGARRRGDRRRPERGSGSRRPDQAGATARGCGRWSGRCPGTCRSSTSAPGSTRRRWPTCSRWPPARLAALTCPPAGPPTDRRPTRPPTARCSSGSSGCWVPTRRSPR